MTRAARTSIEWPTLALLAATYGVWAFATTALAAWNLVVGILVAAVAVAQYSSLQHEVIHGHPFKNATFNAALVFPALTLVLPFFRFKETHLAHHLDSRLTDPYDDPESNYFDSGHWENIPLPIRGILEFNNTLIGRLALGPLIGTLFFFWAEIRNGRQDPKVARGWVLHIPAAALVIGWLTWVSAMPFWSYCMAVYLGLSLLRIRTFLEHQAHERARGRTVIIDDRGPLALLFLNNNYHVVHHMHPKVPWYRLPALFRQNKARYLTQNEGYFFKSYSEIFKKYLLRTKDPVPHPLWRRN